MGMTYCSRVRKAIASKLTVAWRATICTYSVPSHGHHQGHTRQADRLRQDEDARSPTQYGFFIFSFFALSGWRGDVVRVWCDSCFGFW